MIDGQNLWRIESFAVAAASGYRAVQASVFAAVASDPRLRSACRSVGSLVDVLSEISAQPVDVILLADFPAHLGVFPNLGPDRALAIHPGPLPQYRGEDALVWALYHDEPLSVTACLINALASPGPIVGRRVLPVRPGDQFRDIQHRAAEECGRLAVEVLAQAIAGGVPVEAQQEWQGRTFPAADPVAIMAECERRLRDREYSHYA